MLNRSNREKNLIEMLDNKMSREAFLDRTTVVPFHQWLGLILTGIDKYGIELVVRWGKEFAGNKDLDYNRGCI